MGKILGVEGFFFMSYRLHLSTFEGFNKISLPTSIFRLSQTEKAAGIGRISGPLRLIKAPTCAGTIDSNKNGK